MGFPKTAISLQNLRKTLRVRPEVIHLTNSCDSYQALASQSLALLVPTDDKFTKLAMHSQSSMPSGPSATSSSSTCPHCNRKGHNERNCWKLHPEQKPTRGWLFQYLQKMMEEQHMARPAGKRQTRPQRDQRPGSSPTISPKPGPAERLRRAPKPAHILNQFSLFMSHCEADIRNALMPLSVPMTKSGQRAMVEPTEDKNSDSNLGLNGDVSRSARTKQCYPKCTIWRLTLKIVDYPSTTTRREWSRCWGIMIEVWVIV